MPARVLNTGYSGFYFRVLEEGDVRADSAVTQLESHASGITVQDVLRMMKDGRKDERGLSRMLEIDVLSASLKSQFGKWLETLQENQE